MLAPALNLMKSGRFGDALLELRRLHVRQGDPLRHSYVALLSDALSLTGETESAERLADQACRMQGMTGSPLAQCHLVLGGISRDRGDLRHAIWHFDNAFRIAEEVHDQELACWARLRLMTVAGEMDGAEAAIGMFPEIRRRALSLGNPVLLSALHLWVAEFESKRGLLMAAARHIQLGRTVLARCQNLWLEGRAAIDDFCVSFLKSDVRSALSYASQALDAATLSGHATTRMAALTNLAHIHLAHGEIEKAEHYLDDALGLCRKGGGSEVAVLDGLAQLELARGNPARCEEYLDQIEMAGGRQAPGAPHYYQSWSLRTRLQLFLAQGRVQEGCDLVESIRPTLTRFHPSLQVELLGLHGELRLQTGDVENASTHLGRAYAAYDGQSLETFAYVSLALGKALSRIGLSSTAVLHLDRSIRISSHLNHVNAGAEATAALSAVSSTDQSSNSEHTGTRASLILSEPSTATLDDQGKAHILDHVKALIDLQGSPRLLAQEVFALLRNLECTTCLLLVRDDCEAPEIIASSGDGAYTPGSIGRLELRLGTQQNGELLIHVVPRIDLLSQLYCAAVEKIVKALVELSALRRESQERHAIWPLDESGHSGDAIFASAPMREMLQTLRKIAPGNVPVLITGETGTGKEVFARALHQNSKRAERLFTPFNCSAVPRELIEGQLFGHRRGAFSGAHEQFEGVIRAASGGTLFLDEIGEIPLDAQPKLLRFLESGEVHPLGETKPIKTDVRVISATNADVDLMVSQGRFREDLFYRLNVIRFRLPSLRERREEIPLLVGHFLRKYSEEYLKRDLAVSEHTMECFMLYQWPGNVRQLANETRRLVALADSGTVFEPSHLSAELTVDLRTRHSPHDSSNSPELSVSLNQPLSSAVDHLERAMLLHALKESRWRVDDAAKALGLSRKGLYLKRRRLDLLNSP